jgi:hydroxycarboxylate dehydrogenase B
VEAIAPDRLQALATRIFAALGVPQDDASWVAQLLVRANLRGHDSHGVIRVPQYVGSIRKGETHPRPAMRVLAETPTTAILDGDLGLGQVVARRAAEVALDKAARLGLAAVGIRRSNHIGRLADYVEMAAERGFVGLIWANAPTAHSVVPHGGLDRRLSTNPLAIAVPGPGSTVAISVDMATSIVAEGKVRVKRNRKEPLPAGWAIDPAGRPVTDAEVFYGPPRAGLLPTGAHKGTALGLVVEVLGGILSGEGAIGDRSGPVHNGTFLLLIEVARFLPLVDFTGQVTDLVQWVKSAAAAPGVGEVMVPGEPEARSEAHRRAHGIPVEAETWRQIEEIAAELGVG